MTQIYANYDADNDGKKHGWLWRWQRTWWDLNTVFFSSQQKTAGALENSHGPWKLKPICAGHHFHPSCILAKGNLANAKHPFWKCLIHVLPFAASSSHLQARRIIQASHKTAGALENSHGPWKLKPICAGHHFHPSCIFAKGNLANAEHPVLKMPNSCASVCSSVIPFASQENHSSKPQKCRDAWKQSWAMETKTHLRWTPLPSFLHSCKRQLGKRQAPVLKMPNSCTSVYCSVIPFASQDNHSSKPQKCRDAWKQSWAMETKTHLRWTPLPSFLHSCKRQLGKR